LIWLVLIRGTVGGKESCVWIRSLSTMQGLATAMKPKVGLQPIRHMVGIILSPFANPHELVMPSLSFAFCLWCNLSTTKLSAGCWQSGINKVFLIVAVQVLLPLHHVCDITYTLVLLLASLSGKAVFESHLPCRRRHEYIQLKKPYRFTRGQV
jgi:hypothetical protein